MAEKKLESNYELPQMMADSAEEWLKGHDSYPNAEKLAIIHGIKRHRPRIEDDPDTFEDYKKAVRAELNRRRQPAKPKQPLSFGQKILTDYYYVDKRPKPEDFDPDKD